MDYRIYHTSAFMIVYYAFKGSDGGFTFEYVAAIVQHTNIKALLLSLQLGIICTIICLVLSYPLAMILNGLKIKTKALWYLFSCFLCG